MNEDEARVVDVLARDALQRGITTVGGLLDELGQLDRSGARRRLDWARERAGLVSATEADRRRENARFERGLARLQPPPPPRWSALQSCHAPDCRAFPMNDGGALREVTVERWFCPRHRDLAQPGDLEEHEPAYIGISRTGRPIPSAKEAARLAEWAKQHDEKEQRERRQRKEHDEAMAEATDAARERYRDEGQISILGIRCRPDGRLIQ